MYLVIVARARPFLIAILGLGRSQLWGQMLQMMMVTPCIFVLTSCALPACHAQGIKFFLGGTKIPLNTIKALGVRDSPDDILEQWLNLGNLKPSKVQRFRLFMLHWGSHAGDTPFAYMFYCGRINGWP
jgi:hypothetical protein